MIYSDCCLCHEFANKLAHFIYLTCSCESYRQPVHWLELLETHTEVRPCFRHGLLVQL